MSFLRSAIVDMALYFGPPESLKATFQELKRDKRHHTLLLGVLQDLVTHSSFQVRQYTTILFGVSRSVVNPVLSVSVGCSLKWYGNGGLGTGVSISSLSVFVRYSWLGSKGAGNQPHV